MSDHPRTPCHLITGPLGVGKTTAIIDYLKRHAATQFVAVLVNDFGPVGLDSAIMQGDLPPSSQDNTQFLMVPGGCICCSAAAGLIGALKQIAQLPRLDRIIIEPSGLAMVGDMIDLLRDLQRQFPLELRPVITLIDPKDLDRLGFTRAPYYVRMVEAADVLVANRCDLNPPEKVQRFRDWAASLYPPKLRVLTTDHGQLPDEVFDLRLPERSTDDAPAAFDQILQELPDRLPLKAALAPPAQPVIRQDHTAADRAGGLMWPSTTQFSFARFESALKTLAATGFDGTELARLKAIVHTDQGWRLMEIARGQVFIRPTDYRRDNRIDWITQEHALPPGVFRSYLQDLILGSQS